jgi:hypothetical protein
LKAAAGWQHYVSLKAAAGWLHYATTLLGSELLPYGHWLCGDVARDERHPPFQLEMLKIFGHKA